MNKKYLLSLLFVCAIGLVTAAYLVNSFVINTDVMEPFSVEYMIIGDASDWDGTTLCADLDDDDPAWEVGTDVDVGGLYAGEGRVPCAKITNAGEGDVDYTFSAEVIGGLGNLAECQYAFGNPTVSGTVDGLSTVKTGVPVVVADDATPVLDCEVTLSVERG